MWSRANRRLRRAVPSHGDNVGCGS
jgi:hypothetical protein